MNKMIDEEVDCQLQLEAANGVFARDLKDEHTITRGNNLINLCFGKSLKNMVLVSEKK